jgi:hypothetical protein
MSKWRMVMTISVSSVPSAFYFIYSQVFGRSEGPRGGENVENEEPAEPEPEEMEVDADGEPDNEGDYSLLFRRSFVLIDHPLYITTSPLASLHWRM